MLRATADGLARVSETEATEALPMTDHGGDAAKALTHAIPVTGGSDTSTLLNKPTTVPVPARAAEGQDGAGVADEGNRNEGEPTSTIQVGTSIATLVNAFVHELMKPERAPHVAAFLRRLDRGGPVRGGVSTGTKRASEMSLSQRKIVELCSRPEGATGKELAEGCGWPSIAARATCQAEQGQSGLGLEAQRASVRAFAAAQGWTLVAEFSDIASGKDDRRPGFQAALTRCRQLGAVLAAARLDRITRRAHTQKATRGLRCRWVPTARAPWPTAGSCTQPAARRGRGCSIEAR
jgi:hypothetical protein